MRYYRTHITTLFYNKTHVSPECVCEISTQNTPQIINNIILKNAYFEWKQKNAVFMQASLNANELLLPAPFSRIELCLYFYTLPCLCTEMFPFTCMHLADAFIQSDLQCIQAIHFYQYVCSLGIEPTNFALLRQCSTTEPQEHHELY